MVVLELLDDAVLVDFLPPLRAGEGVTAVLVSEADNTDETVFCTSI